MRTDQPRVEPSDVVEAVEQWITHALNASAKYSNHELLGADDAFTLHRLAAEVYAIGWEHGERAEARRQSAQRYRDRDRLAASSGLPGEAQNDE